VKELYCDDPVEFRVLGEVHTTHSARSERTGDRILEDLVAWIDHGLRDTGIIPFRTLPNFSEKNGFGGKIRRIIASEQMQQKRQLERLTIRDARGLKAFGSRTSCPFGVQLIELLPSVSF